MVKDGNAWHYKKYSDSATLAQAEVTARKAKTGLWQSDDPMAPWDYRYSPPSARGPPVVAQPGNDVGGAVAPGESIVFITRTGTKYHRDGCRYLSKSRIPIGLTDAAARYGPCSVCKPPRGTGISRPNPGVTAPVMSSVSAVGRIRWIAKDDSVAQGATKSGLSDGPALPRLRRSRNGQARRPCSGSRNRSRPPPVRSKGGRP